MSMFHMGQFVVVRIKRITTRIQRFKNIAEYIACCQLFYEDIGTQLQSFINSTLIIKCLIYFHKVKQPVFFSAFTTRETGNPDA